MDVQARLVDAIEAVKRDHPDAWWESSVPPGGTSGAISLHAWAIDLAEELHAEWGDRLRIRVGAFGFPRMGVAQQFFGPPAGARVGEAGLRLAWPEPVTVRSGHSADVRVAIENRSGAATVIWSREFLESWIVDPAGRAISCEVTMQHDEGFQTVIPSGETRELDVTVGTTSIRAEIGYAVPPGAWRCVIAFAARGETEGWDCLGDPLDVTVT